MIRVRTIEVLLPSVEARNAFEAKAKTFDNGSNGLITSQQYGFQANPLIVIIYYSVPDMVSTIKKINLLTSEYNGRKTSDTTL